MRPPSSGKAGTRLNTSSAALMNTSQAKQRHSRSDREAFFASSRALVEVATGGERERSPPRRCAATSSVSGGPGRGDLEFLAGRLRFARRARHAAEEPQVDAEDRDAQAPRDERVPQLVQDQRGEIAKRADDGDRIGRAARSTQHFVEILGQDRRSGTRARKNQLDADAHPDAEDARQLNVAAACASVLLWP